MSFSLVNFGQVVDFNRCS